jgi:hypothetical protein
MVRSYGAQLFMLSLYRKLNVNEMLHDYGPTRKAHLSDTFLLYFNLNTYQIIIFAINIQHRAQDG